ncbi:glycosyl transferase [Marinobacter lutaoensis]|uniref:Glycosyl transferase n=1 Tax=Marinobacter lutaoensis TaxID=135739 RepID=A0A1V2DWQ3_9GAMM|nr:glycosyltransferase [Marinobacter lutaoensis]ONF45082.1 glycosyl transferase [Marinobacter lutaoensis]
MTTPHHQSANRNDCLVSFLVPAFKPDFLSEALACIETQGVDRAEVIVCDDSPGTDVARIVEDFARVSRFPVQYQRNEVQLGGLMNMQRCFELSVGRYVKFVNDDDRLLDGATARMVAVLEAHPDIRMVTGRRQLIDETGQVLPDILATHSPFAEDAVIHGADLLRFWSRFPLNFVGEPTSVLLRADELRGCWPHISALGNRMINSVNDLALYVNALGAGHLAYLAQPQSCFRTHGGQAQRQGNATVVGDYGRSVFLAQLDVRGVEPLPLYGHVRVRPLDRPDPSWGRFPLVEHFRDVGRITPEALSEFTFESVRATQRAQGNALALGRWLANRVLSPAQETVLADERGHGPEILVCIRDRNPDDFRLGLAVSAFRIARRFAPGLRCLVLTPEPSRYPEAYFRDVGFVEVGEGGEAAALNRIAGERQGSWLMLADSWDEITPQGMMTLSRELAGAPDSCVAVYGDSLVRDGGHIGGGAFRPDFNLDMLISNPGAMARNWLFRSSAVVALSGFDETLGTAFELDLILRVLEAGGFGAIGHVAEPLLISEPGRPVRNPEEERRVLLAHLARRGYDADVEANPALGTYRVRYRHTGAPLVSIIIPTKDQLPLLQTCVESLLEKTRYRNFEILIVDNNSETAEAQAWLEGMAQLPVDYIRVLRYREPFNYSAINNFAAAQARGEYLLLLNNDTGVLRADWLDEMLNHAQRPEVGIVGAKLLFPSGRVQHGGVVLGLRGPAEHAFIDEELQAPGYMNRLQVDQNYTAVTAACLMVRASVYQQVGGLDEQTFGVSYNDIDFCLRVREAGYLTVWTPHALMMHVANASQNTVDKTALEQKQARFAREQDAMYQRWLPLLANDPAYNRNLTLVGRGFEVEQRIDLTWQPLAGGPRPVALCYPADPWGCGHYRIMKPFEAMKATGELEGLLAHERLTLPELARLNPDVVVVQRQLLDEQIEDMRRIKTLAGKAIVYELDDYLPNLPMKSAYRDTMPRDILKSMRRAMRWVDRFVVSTGPLAEALAGIHPDIRVVENRLPVDWWRGLSSRRRRGHKPRVGWAGGMGHTGDLELIADVVRDLAGEVEWVFFGMCPDALKPYVHERHEGVEIQRYPSKLASLDLDLALAPLEDNLFNRCKSNLRLLEYGACGFPVVCSDVEPYRASGLPVTLVRNRYKEWMDAIRDHLSDPDARERQGDRLKQAVLEDWMLEGDAVRAWREAWSTR